MARRDFEVMLRRQPGYELRLAVKFTARDAYGVLALARPGWEDARPSSSWELEDVTADELRGGRFTLIHPATERREGYSLARLTEDRLARISDTEWTPLEPNTEFGFRYLEVPEDALQPAVVRARVPAATTPPGPAPAARSGSLLDRARHSGRRSNPRRGRALPTPLPDLEPAAVAVAAVEAPPGEVDVASPPVDVRRSALPPRPVPVASVSGTGTPAPGRASSEGRSPDALPGALPARPVPIESSLAEAALDDLDREEAVDRLRAEMQKVWDLHLRLERVEKRLARSLERERDLLALLETWQARQAEEG